VTTFSSGNQMTAAAIIPVLSSSTGQGCKGCIPINVTDGLAGYADYGVGGSVTSVSTTIKVPTLSCSMKITNVEGIAWGVFIDGFGPKQVPTGDVARPLVIGGCYNGVANYYAQYSVQEGKAACISCTGNATWTPVAGDSVYLSVSYNSTTKVWIFTLDDQTKRADYSTIVAEPANINPALNAGGCSAGMRRHSNGAFEPALKFSPALFKECLVDGTGVGAHPDGTSAYEVFCIDAAGTKYIAKPTPLTTQGIFKVTFIFRGP
jgi:hypothetical protein